MKAEMPTTNTPAKVSPGPVRFAYESLDWCDKDGKETLCRNTYTAEFGRADCPPCPEPIAVLQSTTFELTVAFVLGFILSAVARWLWA